jgi:hypothetical protein
VKLSLSKAKLTKALKDGVAVTVDPNGAGTVSVTLMLGKAVAGRAHVKATGAGARKLTIKLTAAAKKKLRGKRSAKLAVAATFTPSSGATAGTARASLTLKR